MQLAAVLFHDGEAKAALPPLLSALQLVEESFREDRHLRLGLLAQLAYAHAESESVTEASSLLPEIRQLAAELDHRTASLQADWIEAMVRNSAGDIAAAERLLLQARQGFLALLDIDHTAIASLDLALLYEEQGRTDGVISLAAEALPVLEAMSLPEGATARDLLRKAIARHQINRPLLHSIRELVVRGWP